MKKQCAVDGCDKVHYGLSYCKLHFDRWKRLGDAGEAAPRRALTAEHGTRSAYIHLRCRCSPCVRANNAYMAQWHNDHPEYKHGEYERNKLTYQASRAAWLSIPANAVRKREMDRRWNDENADRKAETGAAYYRANYERISQQHREKYTTNPDFAATVKARALAWAKDNPERASARWTRWRKDNPDRVSATTHRMRAKRAAAPGSYTHEEWQRRREEYDDRCVYCGSLEKMTPDHVIPLSRPGGTGYIANILPACWECNRVKRARNPEEWRPEFADWFDMWVRGYIPEVIAALERDQLEEHFDDFEQWAATITLTLT